MVQIVWEFSVPRELISEFERQYSSHGSWAALFARSRHFRGTHLLADSERPGRYLTVDSWDDLASFQSFRAEHSTAYEALDRSCEPLTNSEHRLGIFVVS